MANRINYALQKIGVRPVAITSFTTLHGLQSCSDSANSNNDYTMELGQVDTYATTENRPDISITLEKVFDGYPLIYHAATADKSGVAQYALNTRTASPCILALGLYNDVTDTNASGVPTSTAIFSGLYIDSLDYNLNLDSPYTESITFKGSDRAWTTGTDYFDYDFDGLDAPQNAYSSVLSRQNFLMGDTGDFSTFPLDLPGIDASGHNIDSGTKYGASLGNVRISTSLGRTDIMEQGRKGAYYQYGNFPNVDVTCSFEIVTVEGDGVDMEADARNLTNQRINLIVGDETIAGPEHMIQFDLGVKNQISNIENSGGDTSGGNKTTTFTYTTRNTLNVYSEDDPAGHTTITSY